MSEQWYAVYMAQTGQLLSLATLVAPVLPVGSTAEQLAGNPLATGLLWDAPTRQFAAMAPSPLIDRFQDLLVDPRYADFVTAWNALNAAQRTALRTALSRLLGRMRYRSVDDQVDLDA